MSEQDVETIRGAYDDFNSGNPQGVLEILVEDVVWVEPGGGNAPSGTFNSPQSVGDDVFSTIAQYFDEFRPTPRTSTTRETGSWSPAASGARRKAAPSSTGPSSTSSR